MNKNKLPEDIRQEILGNKVYVVVTITNDGERDLFPDVVKITRDEKIATGLVEALKAGKGLKKFGVNKDNLSDYENAAYFTRIIDGKF